VSDLESVSLIIKKYSQHKNMIDKNPDIKIKYMLPMIDCCIVEVDNRNKNLMESLEWIKEEDRDSQISAQMKNVRDQVRCDEIHMKNITGKGIGVAILDTGIVRHNDFGDRIIAFRDFISNRTELYDNNGHGTQVPYSNM
jgi:subtilisin family serine protease